MRAWSGSKGPSPPIRAVAWASAVAAFDDPQGPTPLLEARRIDGGNEVCSSNLLYRLYVNIQIVFYANCVLCRGEWHNNSPSDNRYIVTENVTVVRVVVGRMLGGWAKVPKMGEWISKSNCTHMGVGEYPPYRLLGSGMGSDVPVILSWHSQLQPLWACRP